MFFICLLKTHCTANLLSLPRTYGMPWDSHMCGHVLWPSACTLQCAFLCLCCCPGESCPLQPVVTCKFWSIDNAQSLIVCLACASTAFLSKEWMTLCIWGRIRTALPPKYPQRWTATWQQAYSTTQHPHHSHLRLPVQFIVVVADQVADALCRYHRSHNRHFRTRSEGLTGQRQKCSC